MEIGKYYRVISKDEETSVLHVLAKVNSYQHGECFIGENRVSGLFYLENGIEHYEVSKEKFETYKCI